MRSRRKRLEDGGRGRRAGGEGERVFGMFKRCYRLFEVISDNKNQQSIPILI